MIRRLLAPLLVLLALALAACDGDEAAGTPTPSPTPTVEAPAPTATATATPGGDKARLTTDPALDAIIRAVDERDIRTLAGLVDYQEVGCTTAVGMGGPPKCPEGVEEGAVGASVFPAAACEGYWTETPVVLLGYLAREARGLYAALAVDDPGNDLLPPADRYLVFHRDVNGNAWGFRLHVSAGRIVAAWEGCGAGVEELAADGEVVGGPWADPVAPVEEQPRTSGVAGVDRILAAVEAYDVNALLTSALTAMESLPPVACTTSQEGIGTLPCDTAKGEVDGTEVSVFPLAYCEGALARDPAQPIAQFLNRAPRLYAVVEAPAEPSPSPLYEHGAYWAVYEVEAHYEDGTTDDLGVRLHLTEAGDLAAIWYGCNPTAEDLTLHEGAPLPVILDAR